MTKHRRPPGSGSIHQGYLRFGDSLAHRIAVERTIGRKLTPTEIIHHIDGNKLNNTPENLLLTTQSEHARLHYLENPQATGMRRNGRITLRRDAPPAIPLILRLLYKRFGATRLKRLKKPEQYRLYNRNWNLTPKGRARRNAWLNAKRRAKAPWHIDYTHLTPPLDTESWIEAVSDHHPP